MWSRVVSSAIPTCIPLVLFLALQVPLVSASIQTSQETSNRTIDDLLLAEYHRYKISIKASFKKWFSKN